MPMQSKYQLKLLLLLNLFFQLGFRIKKGIGHPMGKRPVYPLAH